MILEERETNERWFFGHTNFHFNALPLYRLVSNRPVLFPRCFFAATIATAIREITLPRPTYIVPPRGFYATFLTHITRDFAVYQDIADTHTCTSIRVIYTLLKLLFIKNINREGTCLKSTIDIDARNMILPFALFK